MSKVAGRPTRGRLKVITDADDYAALRCGYCQVSVVFSSLAATPLFILTALVLVNVCWDLLNVPGM